jgi:hypothetical protein
MAHLGGEELGGIIEYPGWGFPWIVILSQTPDFLPDALE